MPELADVFACPACRATAVTVEDAAVVCGGCGRRFPVLGDIARFVDGVREDVAQVQRVFDFEHRRYRDSWYTRFEPRLVDLFLADCELPAEFFAGRRVLDAGCGSGRWTYALVNLGADVAAFDLTEGGLEAARDELAGGAGGPLLCQADVFAPPFRPESFDFVLSWGVLHHTPDTRRAFESIVPLVRPGGTLYVMIYERHSRLRELGTDALRAVLRRLSDERRYRFCRRLVLRNRWAHAALSPFLMVAFHDPESAPVDETTMQFGLYDAYSPKFNHLHTREEVAGWFHASGFEDVAVLDTPAGSTIKVRGTRR